jgi:hypothetical protein
MAFLSNQSKKEIMKKGISFIKIFIVSFKKNASNIFTPLNRFAGLLLVSLVLFSLYSYKTQPLKIFKIEIKQAGIKEFISPTDLPDGMLLASRSDKTSIKAPAIDSTSQRFLLIGDSMLETLRYRLNDYCKKNKHTMNAVIWYSSSTLWYGNCDTISYFVNKFNPTYVILVIGANELFIRDIRSRDKFAKNILRQIGNRKYFWVGPPNWKEDTGINNLILRNVGPRRYYPSKKLTYERVKDGAHPTRKSGYMWMDSVAAFIMKKSMYPVLLNYPDTPSIKGPPTVLLGPHPPKGL